MNVFFILVLALFFFFIPAQVSGDDSAGDGKQDFGEWDLKLNLQWHIDCAGENVFTVIDGISTVDPRYEIEGVQIEKGFLYIVVQDENDELALERYSVTLPH